MRLTFALIIYVGLSSCSKTGERSTMQQTDSSSTERVYTAATLDEYKALYNLENYLTTIDDPKVETIDFDCAVLVYPTEEQIDEMKKDYTEEDFYIVADDNNWYQGMAIGMIDSVGIKKITAKGQYLRLKGENKTWDIDLRKSNLPSWNLIFFKRTKEPQIISTVDLTVEEVKDYFEIRE